jgi:predicted transport protein
MRMLLNLGVLAGQDASINGLPLAQTCVDLNSEGPSVPHFVTDSVIEGGMAVFSAMRLGFHLSGAVAEGILLVVNLSIALETFSDDPDAALEQQAGALQQQLQRVGIDNSMELFIGGAVDPSVLGCELMLTPIFRSQDAAANAARALMRPKWLVARIIEIDHDVLELAESKSVSYHNPQFFLEVLPRRYRISLLLALDFDEIDDPLGLAQDASQWKFLVNARHEGGVLLNLSSISEIDSVIPLIRQAHAASGE